MNEYKYRFSIVTAVYNTEKYLEEMIESVILQDIGMENIQLILVDDGSTDNSVNLCKKYAKKYPDNICLIKSLHKGVSHARNLGLKQVQGKYINFLDSDDKLSRDALKKVWAFFEKQDSQLNVVAIPMVFFDQETGPHILNEKFTKDRIVDIESEYWAIQLSSSSAFIRRSALANVVFDEALDYAEDAKLLVEILKKTGKYGLLVEPTYFYRRRKNRSSAIQVSHSQRKWYLDYVKQFSSKIINQADHVEYKGMRSYMHYLVIYDLQWRFNTIKQSRTCLSVKDLLVFFSECRKVMKPVNWMYIKQQKHLNRSGRLCMYLLKASTFSR